VSVATAVELSPNPSPLPVRFIFREQDYDLPRLVGQLRGLLDVMRLAQGGSPADPADPCVLSVYLASPLEIFLGIDGPDTVTTAVSHRLFSLWRRVHRVRAEFSEERVRCAFNVELLKHLDDEADLLSDELAWAVARQVAERRAWTLPIVAPQEPDHLRNAARSLNDLREIELAAP